MFKDVITQPDIYPMLPDLNLPVFVIWGDKDRIHHVSTTELLRKSLPNSEIIIMKDCGAIPMMERPEETSGYYVLFLNKHKIQ
jgi:pimeloyl-ACP methyl ester carboxylesterase